MERPSFSVSSLSTDENQFRSFFFGGGGIFFLFLVSTRKKRSGISLWAEVNSRSNLQKKRNKKLGCIKIKQKSSQLIKWNRKVDHRFRFHCNISSFGRMDWTRNNSKLDIFDSFSIEKRNPADRIGMAANQKTPRSLSFVAHQSRNNFSKSRLGSRPRRVGRDPAVAARIKKPTARGGGRRKKTNEMKKKRGKYGEKERKKERGRERERERGVERRYSPATQILRPVRKTTPTKRKSQKKSQKQAKNDSIVIISGFNGFVSLRISLFDQVQFHRLWKWREYANSPIRPNSKSKSGPIW